MKLHTGSNRSVLAAAVAGLVGIAATQGVAATTFSTGLTTVSSTDGSTVDLGTISATNTGGLARFDGPAYNSGASSGTTLGGSPVAAVGTINATSNTSTGGLITISSSGVPQPYATVGLYDWAAISTGVAGSNQAGTVTGGSQIANFYTVEGTLPASSFGTNVDLTANATFDANSSSLSAAYNTMRVNTAAAITITTGRAVGGNSVGGLLVTPNVGANNTTIAGTVGFQASRDSSNTTYGIVVWQNNTAGELLINAPYVDRKAGASTYTQGGPGTVVLNAVNGYTGQTYLDGGATVISANSALGNVTTGATLNLATGGSLIGNASFALDNAGANARAINLATGGGTLAATTGNTLTVSGVVGGSGPLHVGTGTIAGTGAGTANVASLVGDGVVTLTNSNTYTGGTTVSGGTLVTGNSAALGAGTVNVTAGTLKVGNGTADTLGGITGLTMSDGASLALGGADSAITLASGNFALGAITLDLGNFFNTNGTYTLINGAAGSTDSIGAVSFANADTANHSYSFAVSGTNGVLTVSNVAVPEPASLALVGLAALGLGTRRRRA